MTISNTTPAAAPTNVVNSEQASIVLFGPQSASQTSSQFTVDQHPFTISAYNLGSDDVITVQQVVYLGASQLVSTYQPVYGPALLNQHRSKLRIDQPGRYQLHHTGSSPLGTFTVLGAAFSMSSDGIGELASALQAVITETGVNVIGTSPIVVTGTGTPADPYDVTTPDITVEPVVAGRVLIGHGATGAGASSVAIGDGATAGILASPAGTAVGHNSTASGTTATAFGDAASAIGTASVALGSFSSATAANAVAIYGTATGINSITARGVADGLNSIAIGYNSATPADNSLAIGAYAGNGETHADTVIIGCKTSALNATQDHQIVLGTSTNTQLVTAGSIIQGGVISASDERLKVNIENERGALEALNKLSPVRFNWNQQAVEQFNAVINESEYGKIQHGLIAQEVEDVFPEMVETLDRGSGSFKLVHYDRLISVLIAAVNELSAKVESLENKNG